MKPKNDEMLATEPVGRLLFRLAVPAVTAQLINMLYNLVDRIYIGHMPGDGALALTGVGVCMPVILILSAFAMLVSMGAAPRASIYMGEGNHEMAERILGNSFLLQILISAILTVILEVFRYPFLNLFGASENTIYYAERYLFIYVLGTVFVQLTLGMNAFITAQGFAKTGMMTVLLGAVCNIVLDPIFIFVLGMGVQGAALATVLSQAASMIWAVSFLMGKKTILRLRAKNMRLDARVLAPCVALGISPFIMQSSESILSVCFNSSLLRYGGDIAVGAMTILSSVMQFATLPLQGLSQGAQPITSYNFGARNRERVEKSIRLLVASCVVYSVILWAVVQLVPHLFVSLFSTDAELVTFTTGALRIYAAGLFAIGAQVSCQMSFLALGNAKCSIFLAVLRKFILLIPLIYLLPLFFENKTNAVYLAEPVADLLAAICTVSLFVVHFRKVRRQMEECADSRPD